MQHESTCHVCGADDWSVACSGIRDWEYGVEGEFATSGRTRDQRTDPLGVESGELVRSGARGLEVGGELFVDRPKE